MASQCQIVARHMRTNQAWLSQVLKINMSTNPKHAVFSPDGCYLATAATDRTVPVWDAGTGAPVRELEGHGAAVQDVAFSPDGRYLASGHVVFLWDMATGKNLTWLGVHDAALSSIKFSPDGCYLATASDDCTLRAWNVATQAPLRALKGHTRRCKVLHSHRMAIISPLPQLTARSVCGMLQREHLCKYSWDTLMPCYPSHIHQMAIIWLLPHWVVWYAYGMRLQERLSGNLKGIVKVLTLSHPHQMAVISPLPRVITPCAYGMQQQERLFEYFADILGQCALSHFHQMTAM
jgi:WD40 repeat protein